MSDYKEVLDYCAWVIEGADDNEHKLVPVRHIKALTKADEAAG